MECKMWTSLICFRSSPVYDITLSLWSPPSGVILSYCPEHSPRLLFSGFLPRTSPFSYSHVLIPGMLLFPIGLNIISQDAIYILNLSRASPPWDGTGSKCPQHFPRMLLPGIPLYDIPLFLFPWSPPWDIIVCYCPKWFPRMLFPRFLPRTSPFSYFHNLLPEILLFAIALNNSPGCYSPGSSQGHPPFPISIISSLRYYCLLLP